MSKFLKIVVSYKGLISVTVDVVQSPFTATVLNFVITSHSRYHDCHSRYHDYKSLSSHEKVNRAILPSPGDAPLILSFPDMIHTLHAQCVILGPPPKF